MNVIDCPFEVAGDRWTCPACEFSVSANGRPPPRRNCPKSAELIRRRTDRLVGWLITRYLFSGLATRKAKQAERLLAICQACDRFRGDRCVEIATCSHRGDEPLHVRLTLVDGQCPRDLWPTVNSDGPASTTVPPPRPAPPAAAGSARAVRLC
jgi:hypothetical protein